MAESSPSFSAPQFQPMQVWIRRCGSWSEILQPKHAKTDVVGFDKLVEDLWSDANPWIASRETFEKLCVCIYIYVYCIFYYTYYEYDVRTPSCGVSEVSYKIDINCPFNQWVSEYQWVQSTARQWPSCACTSEAKGLLYLSCSNAAWGFYWLVVIFPMTVKIHTLGVCPPFSDTPKRGDKFFFGRMMRDQRESSIHCRSEHVKQAKWLRWRRLHLICRGLSIHIQKYRKKNGIFTNQVWEALVQSQSGSTGFRRRFRWARSGSTGFAAI